VSSSTPQQQGLRRLHNATPLKPTALTVADTGAVAFLHGQYAAAEAGDWGGSNPLYVKAVLKSMAPSQPSCGILAGACHMLLCSCGRAVLARKPCTGVLLNVHVSVFMAVFMCLPTALAAMWVTLAASCSCWCWVISCCH